MPRPGPADPADPPQRPETLRALWADGVARHDLLALAALGLVAALTVRGHFAMPHPDFFEFVDSGRALVAGELPPTTKRAPLFGLLAAGVGKLLPVEAPERAVAEWLNVLLLPASTLLIYLVGRRWFGPAARWAAAWFVPLPLALYCTAHVIVEPLLTFLILLTIYLSQRDTRWAYLAAALAAVTRYDAAGLLPGVALADALRRGRLAGPLGAAALAGLPLAAWMTVTALTWQARSYDHYLVQIQEQHGREPLRALTSPFATLVDFDSLRLPWWLSLAVDETLGSLRDALRRIGLSWSGLGWLPIFRGLAGLLALLGLAVRLRARDASAVAMAVAVAGYMAVHAVFPFHFERFGFPIAPPLLLLAGAGIAAIAAGWPAALRRSRLVRTAFLLLCGVFVAAALTGEAQTFAAQSGWRNPWAAALVLMLVVALALLWSAPQQPSGGRLGPCVLLLAAALAGAAHVRSSQELLGTGGDLKNQVEAARWVRAHAPPEARVLSASPGLLRLYVGGRTPDRFPGFQDIESSPWGEILAECRRRNIRFVIWHDRLFQEHGPYYAAKWRLDRFDVLGDAAGLPGVVVEARFASFPNLVIVRVE